MKFVKKSALFLGLVPVSLAASWTGSLIDANCYDRQKDAKACNVTQSTAAFALQTADGKVYKLDASGNAKAAPEIRKDLKQATRVTVMGTENGQAIKVEAINFGTGSNKQ